MKTIEIRNDSVSLNLNLNELIILRKSLIEVLSNLEKNEFKIRTGFSTQEIEIILKSVNQIINSVHDENN